MSFLIVESGSTKTDWCFIKKQSKPICLKTSGINPYLQTEEEILHSLKNELNWNFKKHQPDKIYYYGAGAGQKKQQDKIAAALKSYFDIKDIEVQPDILASARALCGAKKGVVCILGTGSNCCYYDGHKIKAQQPSLGYIAGDEGSGNYLGKKVLQYYAYNTFDAELRAAFEQKFGNNINALIKQLYNEPFPNRLLASMVVLLVENRGHFMVENIVEDGLNDFFQVHLMKYRQTWKYPIHFSGSVAYFFKDIIKSLCSQYEFDLGNIIQSPMEGLIAFHKK